MKLFKRIYYPILCVLLIVAIALGFADATYGGGGSKTFDGNLDTINAHVENIAAESHNSHNEANMQTVRNYITAQLRGNDCGMLLAEGDTDDDGNYNVSFRTSGGVPQPTYTVQESTLTPETVSSIESLEDTIVVSKTVRNIVAIIPGTDTKAAVEAGTADYGDAVMLMAHYDSRPEGAGASDNTVSVASMLGLIKQINAGEKTYKNDIVFVFTDAEEEHMYGAYAFKYQFDGFYDVYDRVEIGANFDNLGNKGTLVMFQTSSGNSKLISSYAKINGGAFTSSVADFVYGVMSNFTDFEIYDEKTSLDFANVGGTDIYHTSLDNVENVKERSLEQQYSMMERYVEQYGSLDLATLKSESDSVFFSYLDMGVAHYPKAVAYVMGALILALMIGIIIANVLRAKKNKNVGFSNTKLALGAAAQIITMICTIAVLFVAYFLITLLLAGFGVVPIHALTSLRYASVGLVISAMILTLAVSFGFYGLFKRLFGVKSADIARGTAYIWGLIGAVLCFAVPALSYFFAITALGALAVVLAITLFKEMFREKTGEAMDKLFLYLVPLIFTIPMIIPVMMIAATVLNAVYLPVIMALVLLLAGFIAPYFTQLQPVLDAVMGKLPARKIRVQRTVTKMVEDRAKKGKFTEQTVKEVTKEAIPWRYKNYAGVALLCVISVVMIILFSSFNAGFSSAVAGGYGYRNAIYNDSLVYVWTKNGSTVSSTIEVHDQIAYKFMARGLDGFEWNDEKQAYVKEDTAKSIIASGQEPTITKNSDGSIYTFTPYDGLRSEITLVLNNVSTVTSLSFDNNRDEVYTVTNDGSPTLHVHLPYGYGAFTLTIEGASSLNIEYTEHRAGTDSNINNLREWSELDPVFTQYYPEYLGALRAGIVLQYNVSL